jgi:uncharacterized membrane protein YfcA
MEYALAVATGLLAGVLSGMFGIGGGIVIVPMLVAFLGYSQHRAVGTSLASLLIPIGTAISVYKYAKADNGGVSFGIAAFVTLGLAGGAFLGATLGLKVSDATVGRLFGVLLLAVGLKFVLKPG